MRGFGSTVLALAASAGWRSWLAPRRADTHGSGLTRLVMVDANNRRPAAPAGRAAASTTTPPPRCQRCARTTCLGQPGRAVRRPPWRRRRCTRRAPRATAGSSWRSRPTSPRSTTRPTTGSTARRARRIRASKNFSTLGDPDASCSRSTTCASRRVFRSASSSSATWVSSRAPASSSAAPTCAGRCSRASARGLPAIFPELTPGGSVRTMTGTEEMQLTVAGGGRDAVEAPGDRRQRAVHALPRLPVAAHLRRLRAHRSDARHRRRRALQPAGAEHAGHRPLPARSTSNGAPTTTASRSAGAAAAPRPTAPTSTTTWCSPRCG